MFASDFLRPLPCPPRGLQTVYSAVPVRRAVYGVVGIRAEAGSLRPNEGVADRHSVFLVVPRAGRVRPGLLIPLVASGSQSAPMVALSVPMLSRSNTPIFGCPLRFGHFFKTKQNAWDILEKGGEFFFREPPILKK